VCPLSLYLKYGFFDKLNVILLPKLKESVLEKLIMDEIISQKAESLNISVTQEDVQGQIDTYKQVMGGEESFQEFLKTNNMTEEYLREGIRSEMLMQKYSEEFFSTLKLTDAEIEKFYNDNPEIFVKVRASHILVKTEEEAKDILTQLKNGADFATLAQEKSIDTGSGAQGGDLDYFNRGEMVPEFETIAFDLKPGELSDAVKSEFGYHIIKVTDRLDKFSQVKEDVSNSLKNQKFDESLKELREEADVELLLKK